MTELYRSEDAQQILHIAIAKQAEAGELTRTQLYEIAAELNIAPSDMQAAEQEWQIRRGESVERQAFELQRRQRFQRRVARFAIVNGFLISAESAAYVRAGLVAVYPVGLGRWHSARRLENFPARRRRLRRGFYPLAAETADQAIGFYVG